MQLHRNYCIRGRRIEQRIVLLVVLLAGILSPAHAQKRGEYRSLYVLFRLGANSYGGERSASASNQLQEFRKGAGPGASIEAGYQFHLKLEAGLSYRTGRFPQLLTPKGAPPQFMPITNIESSDWIHMAGVTGRVYIFPHARFKPYVQAGATGSFSLINGRIRSGVGPILGGGITVALSEAADLFLAADGMLIAPGDAMDLAAPSASPDLFSFVGVGIRYRILKRKAGLQIIRLEGPDRLTIAAPGTFHAEVEHEGASQPVTYRWRFGDGTSAAEQTPTHAYDSPGTYTVTLTASDGVSEITRTMQTSVAHPPALPEVLSVRMFPQRILQGQAVQFSSSLRVAEPVSCTWDFGDGAASDRCNPAHVFGSPGVYEVVFKVRNAAGETEVAQQVVVEEDLCASAGPMKTVYFDRNQSVLSVEMKSLLRENITALANCPSLQVEVKGYALPDENNPAQLARARAQAVAQYYFNLGIGQVRVTVTGGVQHQDIPPGAAAWQFQSVETTPF